jgi:hypothetical protein
LYAVFLIDHGKITSEINTVHRTDIAATFTADTGVRVDKESGNDLSNL